MKALSVPVIHLIVVKVNELVSLFGSISVPYSFIQSALKWLWVVLRCFVWLSYFPSFLSSVLVSWWKCNQRRASEGMTLKMYLFTVFQEEAKKAGDEIRNWWAEEVHDRVRNEGNWGSVWWLKPLLSKLWRLKHMIGPSGVIALWHYHLLTDVCAN